MQCADLHELCAASGVPLIEQAGFEADDIVATLAREAAAKGMGRAHPHPRQGHRPGPERPHPHLGHLRQGGPGPARPRGAAGGEGPDSGAGDRLPVHGGRQRRQHQRHRRGRAQDRDEAPGRVRLAQGIAEEQRQAQGQAQGERRGLQATPAAHRRPGHLARGRRDAGAREPRPRSRVQGRPGGLRPSRLPLCPLLPRGVQEHGHRGRQDHGRGGRRQGPGRIPRARAGEEARGGARGGGHRPRSAGRRDRRPGARHRGERWTSAPRSTCRSQARAAPRCRGRPRAPRWRRPSRTPISSWWRTTPSRWRACSAATAWA